MATGLILLAKDTFSAVTSVSIDNVFSATYKQYKIVINASGSTGANISMRLRVSGTDNSSANYGNQYIVGSNTTVSGGRETSQTFWGGVGRLESGIKQINILEVLNPFQSVAASAIGGYTVYASASIETVARVWNMSVTTSYTGFTIAPGFDATTFTGTVTVYGLVQ
jgi:hypothetical protein